MSAKSGLVSLTVVGVLVGATGCSADNQASSDTETQESTASPASSSSSSPSEPSESKKPKPSAPAEETAEITIVDFQFQDPDPVAPGTEITVVNEDSASHTVTAEDDGGFDVTVAGGETVTFTAPSEPGSYPYICNFHGDMTGTLVVK